MIFGTPKTTTHRDPEANPIPPSWLGGGPGHVVESSAPRRRQHEEVERATQYVKDLEDDNSAALTKIAAAEGFITVLEESNKILHDELALVKRENERLVRENTMILTRLATAAEIISGAYAPVPPLRPEGAEPPAKPEPEPNIEEVIADLREAKPRGEAQ